MSSHALVDIFYNFPIDDFSLLSMFHTLIVDINDIYYVKQSRNNNCYSNRDYNFFVGENGLEVMRVNYGIVLHTIQHLYSSHPLLIYKVPNDNSYSIQQFRVCAVIEYY